MSLDVSQQKDVARAPSPHRLGARASCPRRQGVRRPAAPGPIIRRGRRPPPSSLDQHRGRTAQLATGIGNWQHFHIGNIYFISTFVLKKMPNAKP